MAGQALACMHVWMRWQVHAAAASWATCNQRQSAVLLAGAASSCCRAPPEACEVPLQSMRSPVLRRPLATPGPAAHCSRAARATAAARTVRWLLRCTRRCRRGRAVLCSCLLLIPPCRPPALRPAHLAAEGVEQGALRLGATPLRPRLLDHLHQRRAELLVLDGTPAGGRGRISCMPCSGKGGWHGMGAARPSQTHVAVVGASPMPSNRRWASASSSSLEAMVSRLCSSRPGRRQAAGCALLDRRVAEPIRMPGCRSPERSKGAPHFGVPTRMPLEWRVGF